jgi:peptide/nickel transport system substrate-binding protein
MKMNKNQSIIAVMICISVLLAACGGGGTPAAQQEEAKPQFAVYALNSEPLTNWDPAIEFSNGIHLHNNMYEQLLRYDPATEKTLPLLAESYSVSDDGLVWTFKIRQGVKFQNGDALTADDVKYSLDRTIALGAGASYIWSAVESITVKDPQTVEFKLSYKNPLDLVAATGYAAFIYSRKCVNENNEWMAEAKGCGTGPYMLKSAKWGDEVIVEAFTDYWGGWGEKYFSQVVFKKISETASRRQMIEAGEATIAVELPFSDVNALKDNPEVKVNVEPSWQNLIGMFNTQKPPLDNKTVRQALAYAFPYDQVIKSAVGGYARQSYGIVPYGMWGFSDTLPQYKYDLEKARQLLVDAGIPAGQKLLLTYTAGNETEKSTAELYKAELTKLNVDLEIRSMPWDSQWELAKNPDPLARQDIFVMYWWPDLPSPYSFLYSTFHTEQEPLFNLAYYYNADFDALIDQANELSATDIAKAEQMFVDAQKILLDDAATLFIYDRQDIWVTAANLQGFKFNPAYPTVMFFHDMYLAE